MNLPRRSVAFWGLPTGCAAGVLLAVIACRVTADDIDRAPIRYSASKPDNVISRLDQRLRDGKLHQLTIDHTLGNAGIQGKSASVLSRAVGIEENVDVDASMESPVPGDIYLLCSDGLSRMVKDEEIQQTLGTVKDLEEATKILIEKANQGGGRDNITTILVRVQDAKGASAGTMPAKTANAPS